MEKLARNERICRSISKWFNKWSLSLL